MPIEYAGLGGRGQDERILIIGAGMAGSLLALTLGRAGHAVDLIDLRRDPPPDFRNEKLGIDQIAALEQLGVLSCFETACWGEADEAGGHLRPPLKDCGARYDRWIANLRAALPQSVRFVEGRADRIETSRERQTVTLAGGERLDGRLVVLATGRGDRLRASLGVERSIFSKRHSLCLGFSLAPPAGGPWAAPAAIWHGRHGDRIAYVTFFPMLDEVRVNVFCHHDSGDAWVARMREDPVGVLSATLPPARAALVGSRVIRPLEARSTDLYTVAGHVQAGVVLLGDAFHAPCPSSGTGMSRILNDVRLLAHVHVPEWMATPGMGRAKIAAFYDDPAKRAVDDESVRRSLRARALVTSDSLYWRLHRAAAGVKRRLAAAGAQSPARNRSSAALVAAGASCWTQWPAPGTITEPRKSAQAAPGSA